MRRFRLIITALLSAFMLVSCSDGGGIVYNTSKNAPSAGSWTVLVYMIGGSEETQNGTASKKLDEIMSAHYPDNVHTVIETGGSGVWHKKGVYNDYLQRFEAGHDKLYLRSQALSANMGSERTLADFLNWGISTYSSDHYMLILSGLGGGSIRGIGNDELFENDCLTLDEIASALNSAGRSFDVVGMDASLMGSLETANALSAYADYIVAPLDAIDGDAWDYSGFLSYMCEEPSTESIDVCRAICDCNYAKAAENGCEKYASFSVIDASKISTLNQMFDGVAGGMVVATDSLENYKNLSSALLTAHTYGGASEDEGYSNLIDLGDAVLKIAQFVGPTADTLINTLNETVVYKTCGDEQKHSSGLSLYYPLDMNSDNLQKYMDMSLSSKYKEFLRKTCISCSVNTDVPDYTSSWAWNTYNEDMAWLEYQTILENNSYELHISGNMDLFRDVAVNVYKLDKESGKYVFAGRHHDIESDLEGGIFKDSFSLKLPAFSGKTVSMENAGSDGECDIYTFPAAMNMNTSHMRVKPAENNGDYEILGVWNGLNNLGLANSAVKPPSSDKLTPLLSVYDENGVKNEYALGTPSKSRGTVRETVVNDGSYIFEFELTDIYGLKRYGTPVNAKISGKKIIYEQR